MDYVTQIQKSHLNKDVDALKRKVINEFKFLLKKLRKGYRYDYEFILEEISLIELLEHSNVDNANFLQQFYLNNTWQTQF